eukprot:CAMPEP_0183351498 /NCGR_PEP_ID=MMETSP0164_2-20130417/25268_1 /TAXON_ID=221442 /ORGANISM="Coccolithus pelagicus ssp braarudi, Strain PLY182g" /LENGTH=144 /DNA_ID=CAMNT_0025523691 /DNA_START=53 /DNA_END=487 /DNA_ORIENTATION=+
MRVLIALVLFAAVASAAPVPWKNCGTGSSPLKITTLDSDPWPPVEGQNVTITAAGSLSEQVTAGNYDATVSFDGIPILSKSGNICDLDPSKFPCPVPSGSFSKTLTIAVPNLNLQGSIGVKLTVTDQNNKQLICAQLTANIKSE